MSIPTPNSTTSKWCSLYKYIQINNSLFAYIQELLHGCFVLATFLNKMTTAASSPYYSELIPFRALFLMFSLHSFRLSTPSTSIFPISILLQEDCSRTWKSFRNGHSIDHTAFCLCHSQRILTQVWVINHRDKHQHSQGWLHIYFH